MGTIIREGVKTNGRVTLELELGPEVAEGEAVRLEVRVLPAASQPITHGPEHWRGGEDPVPVPGAADPAAAAAAVDEAFGAWAAVPEDAELQRFLDGPLPTAGEPA